jgi:hypothetical protein
MMRSGLDGDAVAFGGAVAGVSFIGVALAWHAVSHRQDITMN